MFIKCERVLNQFKYKEYEILFNPGTDPEA